MASYPIHHLVVENANWSEVLQLRHEGASWDQLRTRTGLPALGMAIFENSTVATQLLLEVGAPAQPQPLQDGTIWSPIWATLAKKNYRILDLLIQAGADPNEPHPKSGLPPLQLAAKAGDRDATLVLCRHGAKPNTNVIPSPLWLWVQHLAPQQTDTTGPWKLPDLAPIIALLSAGARVQEVPHQQSNMGIGALELAERLWFSQTLTPADSENAKLVYTTMKRAALMEQAAELKQSNPGGPRKTQEPKL